MRVRGIPADFLALDRLGMSNFGTLELNSSQYIFTDLETIALPDNVLTMLYMFFFFWHVYETNI